MSVPANHDPPAVLRESADGFTAVLSELGVLEVRLFYVELIVDPANLHAVDPKQPDAPFERLLEAARQAVTVWSERTPKEMTLCVAERSLQGCSMRMIRVWGEAEICPLSLPTWKFNEAVLELCRLLQAAVNPAHIKVGKGLGESHQVRIDTRTVPRAGD